MPFDINYHVTDEPLPGGAPVVIRDDGGRIDAYIARGTTLEDAAAYLGPMFSALGNVNYTPRQHAS